MHKATMHLGIIYIQALAINIQRKKDKKFVSQGWLIMENIFNGLQLINYLHFTGY